jgi:putative DNA methylase
VPLAHVRAQGKARRIGAQLMAIAAEGRRGRVYVAPTAEHERIAHDGTPSWRPEGPIAHDPRAITTPNYGMSEFSHLFTDRQLVALTTFSDLVADARDLAQKHAVEAGMADDGVPAALAASCPRSSGAGLRRCGVQSCGERTARQR